MISIFSEQGKERLDAIVKKGMLCVFDFDGTLAPIVPHADQAYLPDEVRVRLLDLMRLAPVAILTGRSIQDIRRRLGFDPTYALGNHGIEGLPGWETRTRQYRDLCREWVDKLAAALRSDRNFDPAIEIEDKQYSLSVHYRHTANQREMEKRLSELFSTLLPEARVIAGKCVFNLLPPEAEHKGSAMEKLMTLTGASSAIYVGDDITDEDVFGLRRPDMLSVRVEASDSSLADVYLPHPDDILILLDYLIKRLQQCAVKATV